MHSVHADVTVAGDVFQIPGVSDVSDTTIPYTLVCHRGYSDLSPRATNQSTRYRICTLDQGTRASTPIYSFLSLHPGGYMVH